MTESDQYYFDRILAAALANQRAPSRNEVPIYAVRRLERAGAIRRITIDPQCVRVFEILIGPHAGARTQSMSRAQ